MEYCSICQKILVSSAASDTQLQGDALLQAIPIASLPDYETKGLLGRGFVKSRNGKDLVIGVHCSRWEIV